MKTAVCSGSFDPVTNGHIDIFRRAAKIFDRLIVVVFHNIRKEPFFLVEERMRLIRQSTSDIPNLEVDSFDGLLTDYMSKKDVHIIVRGLRSVTDFEYEQTEEKLLRHLDPSVETVFLYSSHEYSFVSSSAVREIAGFGGDIHGLVPECVERAVAEKGGST